MSISVSFYVTIAMDNWIWNASVAETCRAVKKSCLKSFCQDFYDTYVVDQRPVNKWYHSAIRAAGHLCQRPVFYAYRNKTPDYWNEILVNKGGVMAPYLKDFYGPPHNGVNGKTK